MSRQVESRLPRPASLFGPLPSLGPDLPRERPRGASRPTQVIVVGAGPAGLAAAHYLSSHGIPAQTIEMGDRVGGLSLTVQHNGFRFDLGGHRWFTKARELDTWLHDLMPDELLTVTRKSRIHFYSNYYDYPISIRNVLTTIGLKSTIQVLASYLRAALVRTIAPSKPANLQTALTTQFGAKLFEMFFRQYSEKIWGCACHEISSDWVAQRTKGVSIASSIMRSMRGARPVTSFVHTFAYPRRGYGRICERMAEDLALQGSPVELSTSLAALEYEGPHRFVLHCVTLEGARRLEATHVISTMPLPLLVRMIRPAPAADVLHAAESLHFRDLIVVAVMLRRRQVSGDTWLYVHDRDIVFARLHEPKNWSPEMVPDPEYTSLVCECFCSEGDSIWRMEDGSIADRAISDLSDRLRLVRRDEVIDRKVVRVRCAYPIYDLDYRRKVDRILQFVHGLSGLRVIGRGGAFRYNNADHSILMGRVAARRLMGEDIDPLQVNTDAEFLEESWEVNDSRGRRGPSGKGASR